MRFPSNRRTAGIPAWAVVCVHGEQDGAAVLSLPPEGREGRQLPSLEEPGTSGGGQHGQAWQQLGSEILCMGAGRSGTQGLEGRDGSAEESCDPSTSLRAEVLCAPCATVHLAAV